jgi:16S rRNA G527 N7-methylase RsmG
VLYPDSQVGLIESHHRKAVFLREASRAFPNIRVVNTRAEQVAGRFDWIVSRAVSVGPLASTLKRIGQRLALLGGREVAEQLPEIAWAEPIRLPWGQQSFVWLGRTVSRETSLDDERRFT